MHQNFRYYIFDNFTLHKYNFICIIKKEERIYVKYYIS